MSFEDRLIGGPTVNTDISFVTLDMEEEKVKFEIYMSRKDEVKHELVFTRPVMVDDSDEDDLWRIPGEDHFFDYPDDKGGN